MSETNHKLAAIVFTDIVGYTKQMEEDEMRVMQLLQAQRDIISPIVKSYSGEIIKELGDGLLMMFSSAVEAVRCAVSIQTRLKDEDLTIRAGIHIGEVIFKDGDVFGSAVNAAARIQALASANGVCISEAVKHQIRNQTDIKVHSIGIKELKGIKEPMEIYEVVIEGVTKAKKIGITDVFQELWSRRVIQVLAVYLVGAFLVRMAVNTFVTSNLLSPHLVGLTWVILLSLIPSVILLTFFHGYRTSGKWAKAELIGFPSNVVFSILLIIFLFKGKDLGAATTTVSFEDENGIRTERTIMKNEFRKKTLVFFFENKSTDTSLNWLQYALPNLIEYDASQDIFWEVWGAGNFINKWKDKGIKNVIETSLGEKKKITSDTHRNYFLAGTFNMSNGLYTVTTKLYSTETANTIVENKFSGDNIFQIVDEITLKLKKDLKIPESHIEETVDLPVSEIYTGSFKALEYFTKGYQEALFSNQWINGIKYMEKAIAEDKGFIYAYENLAAYCTNTNQIEKAIHSLQIVIDSKDKLPQRYQFASQFLYRFLRQEPDKALDVCKAWVNFSPEDVNAHSMLFLIYGIRNEIDLMIQEGNAMLKLDQDQGEVIRAIGNLYLHQDKIDSAIIYFDLYTKKFPNDYTSLLNLGNLYLKQAKFTDAIKQFENALILEPGNIQIYMMIADAELREGNFAIALERYNEGLAFSKSAKDSSMVYGNLYSFYYIKGEMIKSLEFFKEYTEISRRYLPPFQSLLIPLDNVDGYILAGNSDEIYKLLKSIEKEMQSSYDNAASMGFVEYYIELENADEAEKYLAFAEALYSSFGGEKSLGDIYKAKARIAEIRKDYKTALDNYEKYSELQPGSYGAYRGISLCLRELGELKEAKQNIEKALKQYPYQPRNNYEAAMVYLKLNDKEKAKEHLNRALEVWKDADTTYKPYQQALEAKKQLAESNS